MTRRTALRLGSSPQVRRLLGFYSAHGLVPVIKADEPIVPPPPDGRIDALQGRADFLESMWDQFLPRIPPPAFADLTEQPDDAEVPLLDRHDAPTEPLSADQEHWRAEGYLVKKHFIPDDLVDAYWSVRSKVEDPHAWHSPVPYMHIPEALNLSVYLPLTELLEQLIGERMAVNLNLTGTVSTERNWHQDDYLNPPHVNGWYAAVWMAVGDIDPDSGPFQYVPGSHRWPVLRRDRVQLFIPPDRRYHHDWPRFTEQFLSEILEKEIAERGGRIESFVGEKGDILIWHARLMHRGTVAKVPGRQRRSFIAHYTGVDHWAGQLGIAVHPGGGSYCLSNESLDRG